MHELPGIALGNRAGSQAVRTLAAAQDGVVTRAQLLAAGLSSAAIGRAVRAGRLHRLHPGVYSLPAPELLTEDARLIAALFAAGAGAMLACGTAAWRWELIPAPPVAIELAVPWPRAAPNGVVLLELGRLWPGEVTWNGRFRTTSVARTALDLAVRYDQRALVRMLAEAEFQHDLRPEGVKRVLRRGHPGSANLRAALDAHAPGHGKAKSGLERAFRRLLITHGIELPTRNAQIGPYEVDCVWPEHRVVVELDARQHERPAQADRDDDRDLWLRARGYLVRRYGAKQVSGSSDAVIADLLAAFAQAQALADLEGSPPCPRA